MSFQTPLFSFIALHIVLIEATSLTSGSPCLTTSYTLKHVICYMVSSQDAMILSTFDNPWNKHF